MPAPEPRTAQPGGRPEGGPTALPARSGPARPGRGGCPLARPPTSVRPGSPQLPVVFLLLEQLPGLRHGPCRTPPPPPPPPPPPRTRRRTECPSPLLPPTRCLQGAPPLHCARVAGTPGCSQLQRGSPGLGLMIHLPLMRQPP